MTNKELIADARKVECRVRSTLDTTVADLVRDLADALEAATSETGWEYRYAEVYDDGMHTYGPEENIIEGSFDTAEAARAARIEPTDIVVRRPKRAAGPWEPVGGESQ